MSKIQQHEKTEATNVDVVENFQHILINNFITEKRGPHAFDKAADACIPTNGQSLYTWATPKIDLAFHGTKVYTVIPTTFKPHPWPLELFDRPELVWNISPYKSHECDYLNRRVLLVVLQP